MSIQFSESFRQVLLTQRINLLEFEERLQSARREDDLDLLFCEIGHQRSQIADLIKHNADRFDKIELIELQSRLNLELDERISPAIKTMIDERTRSLTEQALRDPLTKLFNRAAFDRRLHDEIERGRRYQRELSLILFDLDRFKSVNDRFGHQTGDRFLLHIAHILQSSLRRSDSTFRYGGDEFAAICPETSGVAILSMLSRIETRLRIYCLEAGFGSQTGISWGIASFPIDANTVDALISVADRRLYSCKSEHHYSLAAKR